MKIMKLMIGVTLALAVSVGGSFAMAQSAQWPTKPVRWIVPFAPGGPGDVTARIVAQKLSERWGQQVFVENKPGANTVIGAVEAAKAAPDGYTLFQPMNSTLTINQFAMTRIPYDSVRDYSHIGVIASVPLLVVVNDTMPAKSITELIALAKANPDTVTVGGGNVGQQLAVERFARDAGIKLRYIPYKSGADVTKALLSKEIQAGFDGVPAYPALLKAGSLRALATNSPRRISLLPDVPALAEFGLKNSDAPLWHAVVAPAGLPPDIKARIASDIQAVLLMPDVKERFAGLGLEPTWVPGDEFVKLIQTESAAMGPIVKELGIKMD
jgi:tripartite-type tricarboxylate transporter receptor subunit TctC